MVTVNKKLAARLAAKKNAQGEAPVDPKKGGKAPPPAKKEEPPKKDNKKGGPTEEELEAERERLRLEAEEAERKRLEELEKNFDRKGELGRMGGKVTDFDVDDENRRTQHYDWLLPVHFRLAESMDPTVNCMYL